MPVFRTEKTNDYAVIAKHHLKNRALSYKAKGLLTFMLSVPPDWDWSMAGLSTLASDGIDGVRSGIRELEKYGYLTRRRIRDVGGKLGDIEYTIHEIPKPPQGGGDSDSPPREPSVSNKQNSESPASGKPILENPTLVSPELNKPILDFPTLDKPTQDLPTQANQMQCITNPLSIESELSIKELSNKKYTQPCAPVVDVDSDNDRQLSLEDTVYSNQQAERLSVQKAQGADKSVDHAMTFVEQQFETFWQLYPRKAGKKAARKAWRDIEPNELLLSTIMGALNNAVQYWHHQGVAIKHIPHPSTWLNEERWEDEFSSEQLLQVSTVPSGHANKYAEKRGGDHNATIGADYRIGGEDDPYRAVMPE